MEPGSRSSRTATLIYIGKWSALSCLAGTLAGTASACFLLTLERVTEWREGHVWIIALLPAAGLALGWVYHRFGRAVERGNNLLLDEVHDPRSVVPLRMAPFIFFGTVATHLFGGSAGREGTAVQMGGSLADQLTRLFRLSPDDRRIILMAGMSAGFASVFGTPLAGAIFGLEVLTVGRMRYDSIFPCFLAAIVAHEVTTSVFHVSHTAYAVNAVPAVSFLALLCAVAAGMVFGVTGRLFAGTTHRVSAWFKERITYAPFRPLVGGAVIAAIILGFGLTRYAGLGIPVMRQAFSGEIPLYDFLAKFLLTCLTLGAGFKGGEVTPLFFIGSTLGNSLSHVLPLPMPLLAALGFVAVFAGAANVPLACTVMAMEIFGPGVGVYAAIACVVSYLFSGHAGIYASQRAADRKPGS